MKKKIYIVEHFCGWGPYKSSYHATLSGAKKAFESKAKELRSQDDYIRGSWEKNPVSFENPFVVRHEHFQTQKEMNNESGHEFWEEDEYLDIREEVLNP